jgi:hypothetical protein
MQMKGRSTARGMACLGLAVVLLAVGWLRRNARKRARLPVLLVRGNREDGLHLAYSRDVKKWTALKKRLVSVARSAAS